MLRYLFVFVMFIHGLIHLMGFAKAFGYSGVNQITGEISRMSGIFWLIGTVLFVLAAFLFLVKNDSWFWVALLACATSQTLIFMLWKDAKFGTIANVIIVVAAIIIAAGKEMKYVFRD